MMSFECEPGLSRNQKAKLRKKTARSRALRGDTEERGVPSGHAGEPEMATACRARAAEARIASGDGAEAAGQGAGGRAAVEEVGAGRRSVGATGEGTVPREGGRCASDEAGRPEGAPAWPDGDAAGSPRSLARKRRRAETSPPPRPEDGGDVWLRLASLGKESDHARAGKAGSVAGDEEAVEAAGDGEAAVAADGGTEPRTVPGHPGRRERDLRGGDSNGGGGGCGSSDPPAPHGNYHRYYGYRLGQRGGTEDPRLGVLQRGWFLNKRALDVGCNEGAVTMAIAQLFAPRAMVGVDVDAQLVSRAIAGLRRAKGEARARCERSRRQGTPAGERRAAALALRGLGACWFVQGDVLEGVAEPGSVDVITCFSVTKWVHLNGGDEALRRLFDKFRALLARGGLLVLEPQPWKSYLAAVGKLRRQAAALSRGERDPSAPPPPSPRGAGGATPLTAPGEETLSAADAAPSREAGAPPEAPSPAVPQTPEALISAPVEASSPAVPGLPAPGAAAPPALPAPPGAPPSSSPTHPPAPALLSAYRHRHLSSLLLRPEFFPQLLADEFGLHLVRRHEPTKGEKGFNREILIFRKV